jgi:hypothetical protein
VRFSILAAFLFTFFVGPALQAQTDPFLGTWKLDLTKSRFDPGPAPQDETRVVVTGPKGMHVAIKRVSANHQTQEFEYTSNLDGKQYPIIGDSPDGADSIALNLTSPNTLQVTSRKAGKTIETASVTISGDGRSMTISSTGTTANGTHFKYLEFFNRQ